MRAREHDKNATVEPGPSATGDPLRSGVEPAHAEGHRDGRADGRHSTAAATPDSSAGGEGSRLPEAVEHHQRSRPPKRVRPEEVDEFEVQLRDAFRSGNPKQVWDLVQQLLTLSREVAVEAGQARFRANYGTPTCEKCDGLKAGKGVIATCFQLKRCYYSNLKEADTSRKQKQIIEGLTRGQSGP